ncbi:MAG: LacI family DNA-binding transcriptional regulator, partial [Devosia sp.]
MRPTAKDLAKAAGVSLATIDRVLNDRPNVSKKAADRVAEAIERIGFVRNPAAVNLARNTTYRFRFILPVAWERPNEFRKVLSIVGSFVNLRGGHVYPERVLES